MCQLLPSRRQVERDAVHVSGQSGGAHQQTHQDQVRKRGREVHRLSDTETDRRSDSRSDTGSRHTLPVRHGDGQTGQTASQSPGAGTHRLSDTETVRRVRQQVRHREQAHAACQTRRRADGSDSRSDTACQTRRQIDGSDSRRKTPAAGTACEHSPFPVSTISAGQTRRSANIGKDPEQPQVALPLRTTQ